MGMVRVESQGFNPLLRERVVECAAAWSSFCGGIFEGVDQFLCGLTGHDELLHFEPTRLSLHCSRCGHYSAGWEIRATGDGAGAKRPRSALSAFPGGTCSRPVTLVV
jgi:hypothetical protein